MSLGWNFERRRDTCAQFLIGVWILGEGRAERSTNLEGVRARVRLSPEEALFAARRLHEEEFIVFDRGGTVRSNARGIERAAEIISAVRRKAERHHETTRTLEAGGTPVGVVAAVIRADGGALRCGAPDDDSDGVYRLALNEEHMVVIERQQPDGAFISERP
jgi:hypothetical protein